MNIRTAKRWHVLLIRGAPKNNPTFKPLSFNATQEIETEAQHKDVLSPKKGVSQHVCEDCGQALTEEKVIPGHSTNKDET